ncbi:diguanylate cyclase [Breoghania sp.]|uniref:diguanylate cyclase n=1 Tax=Breoghania sp. TaxID=2065378 RepID=UPI00260227CD|nr:diguanylate cyclase [Breoghania sp.]
MAFAFLVNWWRNPSDRLLGYSTVTFGLTGSGMLLLALRGHVPNFLSIDIDNILIFAALALGWNTFRFMNGRRVLMAPLVLPVVVWFVSCRIPAIYSDTSMRTAIASLLACGLFCGYWCEFMRTHATKASNRKVLLFAAGANVLVFGAKGIYSLVTGQPNKLLDGNIWLALALFAPVIFVALMAMAGFWLWQARAVGQFAARGRDRSPDGRPQPSRVRPQCGDAVEAGLLAARHNGAAADRYRPFQGDQRRLRASGWGSGSAGVCRALQELLRKSDLLARYGGEEFVVLLPEADIEDARQVAEKLCTHIADL